MSKTPTAPDPYQDWIASHVFQHNDGVDFEARMATWPQAPRFHLAVAQDTASVQALSLTLQSLAGQYYPHLFVSVASPLVAPSGLPADRIAWIRTDATWQGADQALRDGPDAWVGLIRAGDRIAPHAFLALAEHIVSHPELAALYTDEDICAENGLRHSPRFKPDFDRELLRSTAYLGGLLLARRDTWTQAGGWQPYPAGAGELDLALRLDEHLSPGTIGHLPDLVYHRHPDHPALQTDAVADQEKLARLNAHLARTSPGTQAIAGQAPGTARVLYPLTGTPRVSIIIPTKDQVGLLERCINGLIGQTAYPDYEVLIVDNGSTDPTACAYLDGIRQLDDARLRVLDYAHPFNFAAMNNLAACEASGSMLLLLNNDTAVLHEDWLAEMVALAQQPEVGMVGARLLYPDGSLQHAGVVLGLGGPAEHPLIGWPNDKPSPLQRSHALQRYSAVTAACALIPRTLYLDVGGMDEAAFRVSYNDVDLCLKIGKRGLRILWTPYATLLHEGSATQLKVPPSTAQKTEKEIRFATEQDTMYQRWMPLLARDPAFNPNLSLVDRDLRPEPEAVLSWNPTPWDPRARLLVHPIDLAGCGEYRVLAPSRALHNAGLCRGHASMRFFSAVEIYKAKLRTVVIQHPTTVRHLRAIEIYRKHSEAHCIVEIDDLVTDIPKTNPHHLQFGKEAISCLRRSLELADRLVVSTTALADAFGAWANQVVVQPNRLERRRWEGLLKLPHQPRRRPRVGWAGSSSHVGDLRMISTVIRRLAKEVDWIFLGLFLPELKGYAAEVHPAVPIAEYPRRLAELDLDLAVAPLEVNAFNEAKSALKILEYGILGIPVICTDILPYRGAFPVTRVPNIESEWISAIRDLCYDSQRREREGSHLRKHIESHWILENHLNDWAETWLLKN